MFAIDWRLALFSMGAAPVLFGIAAYFRKWVRDAFRDIRVRLARMNAFLQEHISGMKVVQAFAQEPQVARNFDVINVAYRKANSRAIAADAWLYSIVEAVGIDRHSRPAVARREPDRRGHADLRGGGRLH
jgi:ATP-binding cassette subfamily B protein